MIEAVNTVIQNAPLVRGTTEQASTLDSFAANPDRVQKAPQAPFISPFIHVDAGSNKAVLQIRDSETGDVLKQFPSESRLKAQTRATELATSRKDSSSAPQSSEDSAQAFIQAQETSREVAAATAEASAPAQAQQIAAFEAAAQSGNTNAGNVTVFA